MFTIVPRLTPTAYAVGYSLSPFGLGRGRASLYAQRPDASFEHLVTPILRRAPVRKAERLCKNVIMQKIVPFLWFDDKAEKAMNFYTSIFGNSKIASVTRYGEKGPGPKGTVMTAAFELEGQKFTALNGGPLFKFTEAISFLVNCETQEEVDRLWEKLSEGGEESRCGWLKDKFGVSWQIIPTALGQMLSDKDPAKSGRVMQAMLQMNKLDIKGLRQAYEKG